MLKILQTATNVKDDLWLSYFFLRLGLNEIFFIKSWQYCLEKNDALGSISTLFL